MAESNESLGQTPTGNEETRAVGHLAASAAATASLLLASSITLGAVDPQTTPSLVQETGPATEALARAFALLEDTGIAESARNSALELDVAQWDNWCNAPNCR